VELKEKHVTQPTMETTNIEQLYKEELNPHRDECTNLFRWCPCEWRTFDPFGYEHMFGRESVVHVRHNDFLDVTISLPQTETATIEERQYATNLSVLRRRCGGAAVITVVILDMVMFVIGIAMKSRMKLITKVHLVLCLSYVIHFHVRTGRKGI
jgi:hypothetical protein